MDQRRAALLYERTGHCTAYASGDGFQLTAACPSAGLYRSAIESSVPCVTYLPTAPHVRCISVVENGDRQMLNPDAFRDLCRKAAAEKDPAKLEDIKKALRFMLQSEGIEMERLEKKPSIKPN